MEPDKLYAQLTSSIDDGLWEEKILSTTTKGFNSLPVELKHMVYSKLLLPERAAFGRVSWEASQYFRKHTIKSGVLISLFTEDDKHYVAVDFDCETMYIEFHQIPDEKIEYLENDRTDVGYCCDFCDEYGYDSCTKRYFPVQSFREMKLFETIAFVDIQRFWIRSAPVHSLMDTVQPVGFLPKKTQLDIYVHLREGVLYPRNNLNINVEKWGRWIDFANPQTIRFVTNRFDDEGDEIYGHFYSKPFVYLPKELLDLKSVRNTESIHSEYGLRMDYRQLSKMKAHSIYLPPVRSLTSLCAMDVFEFYVDKIKEWLLNVELDFNYRFQSADQLRNPPHLNRLKLLADMTTVLQSDDFRVYINFFPINPRHKKCGSNCITIRCVEVNKVLMIGPDRMRTWNATAEMKWPEPIVM